VWRLDAEVGVSRALRQQLWRQLVVAKIRAQARNLPADQSAHKKLLALAREVRSGDPANIESQAARVYWANWLAPIAAEETPGFRRDPELPGLNSFLNYGYAVLRAAVARAIVAAGLMPSLGLHHHNRSNAFCLADDLIEPLRPLVDDRVRELHRQGYEELSQPAKAALLEILTEQVSLGAGDENTGPLMVQMHRYVASLLRCFTGDERELEIPVAVSDPCSQSPAC
jgi:CRISPR-associated protein Cas1